MSFTTSVWQHYNSSSLVCFHRSVNNQGEVRQLKSFNRYSKNSDVPNNALGNVTHAVVWCNSASARRIQEHSNTKDCDTLLSSYKTYHRCHSCDCTLNQRKNCDEVQDMIITMKNLPNSKTNSYTTSKTWPNVLRACKKSTPVTEDSSEVAEPCLRNQQETCMWLLKSVPCAGETAVPRARTLKVKFLWV